MQNIASQFLPVFPSFAIYGLRIYNPVSPTPPIRGWENWDADWDFGGRRATNLQIFAKEYGVPWSKESRQSRGYGPEWEKARVLVIERAKGLCEECARQGRVTPGKDVDHKVSRAKAKVLRWTKAKTEHPSNLQYLCRTCHKRKTAEENGLTYNEPRPATGLDGWPEE